MTARDASNESAELSRRLDRVVVGVDFSAPSITAVRWTLSHLAPASDCIVVHALDVPEPPGFLRGAFPGRQEIIRSARAGAAARIERLRDGQEWGDVRIDIREGRAEDAIARAIEEAGADMVVVGEHAHPRGIWSTLGSTAEALVRSAAVPVLLARNPPDHPPQRILVAVDESSLARSALAWTHMLARRFDARVTVCHVFDAYFLGAARALSGMQMSAELEQSQRDQTRAWLETSVRDAGFANDEVDMRVEPGDPVSALVAAQRGGDFDLVVIGSRGAGGAGRMLLGTVAGGVLRGATCPVLVVGAGG